MKNNELVSILLPIYNVELYIEECLASLSRQSYKNIEVIMIDDGSTDRSGAICDEFSKRDSRFRVIHQENKGVSAARNLAISEASGDCVCFVDPDDTVSIDYIKKLYSVFGEDVDISVCSHNNNDKYFGRISGIEATMRLLVQQKDRDIVVWGKLYRKKLFNEIVFPVGDIHEDTLTSYKIYSKARNLVYLNDELYNYRIRVGSITEKSSLMRLLEDRERAAIESKEYLDEEYDDATNIALLLSWFRYIDCSISGEIDKKYFGDYRCKIMHNINDFKPNKLLSTRLRLYLLFLLSPSGLLYRLFRKIKK